MPSNDISPAVQYQQPPADFEPAPPDPGPTDGQPAEPAEVQPPEPIGPNRPDPSRPAWEIQARQQFESLRLGPDWVVEVRIFDATINKQGYVVKEDTYQRTVSGYFDDPDRYIAELRRVKNVSVYITINQVRRLLLARANNKLRVVPKGGKTTSDDEIVRRVFAYIDIDSKRDSGTSATGKQLVHATAMRDQILSEHPEIAASALWGCSGNGAYIFVRIDLPNDAESEAAVKEFASIFADKHDNEHAHIDRKVYNAARVGPAVGTWKIKGDQTEDQRYRRVTRDSPPGDLPVLDLRSWVAEHRQQQATHETPPTPPRATARQGTADLTGHYVEYARGVLVEEATNVASAQPGSRNATLNIAAFACGTLAAHGYLTAHEIVSDLTVAAGQAGLDAPEIAKTIASGLEAGMAHPRDMSGVGSEMKARMTGDRRRDPTNGERAPDGPATHSPPDDTDPLLIKETDDDPWRIARKIAEKYTDGGILTVREHQGDTYRYEGARWRRDDHFARLGILGDIKEEVDRCFVKNLVAYRISTANAGQEPGKKAPKEPVPMHVTTRLANNVRQIVAKITSTETNQEPPLWMPARGDDPPAENILPALNGLVDLTQPIPSLSPHTPRFFGLNTLSYPYEPHAPEPARWLRFLRDQWADDPECIDTLHEMLGYLLTGDISQQKIFILYGPPRSGRSLIREVLTALVGSHSVAATSPASLADRFGLEPLQGKSVAVMGDARTSEYDTAAMMDRLLRISGADDIDVNRKGKEMVKKRLKCRVIIITNELPNFRDASGANVHRYLILPTTHTIPEEDRDADLGDKIIRHELPGILNLAIEGRYRLRERGRFVQPASGQHLIDDAAEIASPVRRFVLEKCTIAQGEEVPKERLFSEWKAWATMHGFQPGNSSVFGKNLKAAFPTIRDSRPRSKEHPDTQVYSYSGISIGVHLSAFGPP